MNFLIGQNEYFIVEHSYSCALPGYLIVSPTIEVTSINELPDTTQVLLGPTLASATDVVNYTVNPIKIYCAQFGEEDTHLHFHIFPRTREITTEFLAEFPGQSELIYGPIFLDWARSKYRGSKKEVWAATSPVIGKMKAHYKEAQRDKTHSANHLSTKHSVGRLSS